MDRFDFDSKGNLYIAVYNGFMAKYPPSASHSCCLTQRVMDKSFSKKMNNIITQYSVNGRLFPEIIIILFLLRILAEDLLNIYILKKFATE